VTLKFFFSSKLESDGIIKKILSIKNYIHLFLSDIFAFEIFYLKNVYFL
jgi:hypothetical protein